MASEANGGEPLKTTPLHSRHVALGARMVPFAGYDMPVQYPKGIIAEQQKVDARRRKGAAALKAKQREYEEFAGTFSALDGQPYQPSLDYRRKRGLVEEINRTIQDIEVDAAARASLRTPNHVKPGLVQRHSSAQGAAPSAPR